MTEFEQGPLLWLPKHKEIVVPARLPRPLLRGWYKMEVEGPDGRRRTVAEFPNLLTNHGADLYGTVAGPALYCLVGSGNATPAVTDTALQSFVAVTSTLVTQSFGNSGGAGPTYYAYHNIQYSFAAGVATGNLSEVGVGHTFGNSDLFSRALILDALGSPTTITVLSNESLYVTYQMNQYAPTVDVTGSVNLSPGGTFAYTLRAAYAGAAQWQPSLLFGNSGNLSNMFAYSGSIGALTSTPSGTQDVATSVSTDAYSTSSYQLTSHATFGLLSSNFGGGIGAVMMLTQSHGYFQIGFTPNIPKDASHVLVLDVGHNWTINSP